MREATGNTFMFYVIIVFILLVMLILMGSISYSKAFKAKNKIIRMIEDNRGFDEEVKEQIDEYLHSSGYRLSTAFTKNCPSPKDEQSQIQDKDRYLYCVYSTDTIRGTYYSVVIYMRFEIPIISGLLEFPVSGDTRTIYNVNYTEEEA